MGSAAIEPAARYVCLRFSCTGNRVVANDVVEDGIYCSPRIEK